MDKFIYKKLHNVLKAEAEYIMQHENNITDKTNKLDIIFNLAKIIDNYDELEPVMQKFFNEKVIKEKHNR